MLSSARITRTRRIDELEDLPAADQAAIMGGNLAKLMGVDPTAKAV